MSRGELLVSTDAKTLKRYVTLTLMRLNFALIRSDRHQGLDALALDSNRLQRYSPVFQAQHRQPGLETRP